MTRLLSCAVLCATFLATPLSAQTVDSDGYRIYRSDGTPATEAELTKALEDVDVVFIGELHNDPVSHFIEKMVFEKMFAVHGHASAASMEMFARDVQYIVDEYLDGLISESHFQLSSSPWSNYETDYKPIVEFARERGLDVVAANAPRRYANRVTREGRDALNDLSDRARSFLAPLPYGSPSALYKEQWDAVMAAAMEEMMAAMKPTEDAPPKTLCSSEEGGCGMEHEMEHGEGEGHEMEHGEAEEMDHEAMHAAHHPEGSEKSHEEEHEAMHGEGEGNEMEHEVGEGEGHEMKHEMEEGEGHEMIHEMDEDAHHEGDEDEHAAMHESDEDAAPAMMPSSGEHGGGSMLDAQSLWDATMAWSIAEYMTRNPGSKVTHMVGGFHVDSGTGIPEHLMQYRPGTKMLIISNQSVDDINMFDVEEHTGLGDFVILGDASLPRTYETRER